MGEEFVTSRGGGCDRDPGDSEGARTLDRMDENALALPGLQLPKKLYFAEGLR